MFRAFSQTKQAGRKPIIFKEGLEMDRIISSKIKYINIIIVLFLIFGFRYLHPFSTLTPTGMHVLGIFLGVVYGWSTVDLIWPGFFAIISMSFVEGFDFNLNYCWWVW